MSKFEYELSSDELEVFEAEQAAAQFAGVQRQIDSSVNSLKKDITIGDNSTLKQALAPVVSDVKTQIVQTVVNETVKATTNTTPSTTTAPEEKKTNKALVAGGVAAAGLAAYFLMGE